MAIAKTARMVRANMIILFAVFATLVASLAPQVASVAGAQSNCSGVFFNETNHCLQEPFLSYWQQNGGLPIFGYPLTEAKTEHTELGPRQVQWFERQRMEFHPGNAPEWQILLGRIGAELHDQHNSGIWVTPEDPQWGKNIFAALVADARSRPDSMRNIGLVLSNHAHNVGQPVLYNGVWVVFFERAVAEWHVNLENSSSSTILYRRLGADVLGENNPAQPAPSNQCLVEKIATYPERSNGGLDRIVVGGSAPQNLDLYHPGEPAVVYMIPPKDPTSAVDWIAHGLGSQFQVLNWPCEYDHAADAIRYAGDRINNGGSSVVIDLYAGRLSIVAMPPDMSQEEARQIVLNSLDNWESLPVSHEITFDLRARP